MITGKAFVRLWMIAALILSTYGAPLLIASLADEPTASQGADPAVASAELGRVPPAVRDALAPLAKSIAQADHTRALVELTTRSMIDGRIIDSESSRFRIASSRPNLYRTELEADQPIKVVSNGDQVSVLLGKDAYYQLKAPQSLQEAVVSLPAPLGPYPEPLMAMTLAGVDVAQSLLSDMKSLELVKREPYDGTEAVQLRGVQADGVSWVLWVAEGETAPRPLRMKIDLTAIVVSDGAELPENFAFEIDYKFTLWRSDGAINQSVYAFSPPEGAQRYQSLEDYAEAMNAQAAMHPLVGEPAPDFGTQQLDGTAWELAQQRGKVVVLDFWATWCGPCIEAMPVIAEVAESFADRDVLVYAVNIGQSAEQIKPFLEQHQIGLPVLLDPEGAISDAYQAEAIPQTVLIGKDGRVEAVHIGFGGTDALKQTLMEQLEVLASGRHLQAAEED